MVPFFLRMEPHFKFQIENIKTTLIRKLVEKLRENGEPFEANARVVVTFR